MENKNNTEKPGKKGSCCSINNRNCCHAEQEKGSRRDDLKKIIISAVFFALALALEHLSIFRQGSVLVHQYPVLIRLLPDIGIILYFIAYITCGLGVIKKAVLNLLHGSLFDENFLMSVATLGAVAIGQYPEAVAVMLFYRIGEFFENYAVGESRKSISALMRIRPDKAFLLKDGKPVEVKPEEVRINDRILVKPGDRVPLDGIVVKGETYVDTSSLTGEPVPRKITENSEVLAGFVNTGSAIEIRVTKSYENSAVAHIVELVEHAEDRKACTERFITRFARYYTPVVCLAAVLLAVIPPFLFHGTWNTWIYRGLVFLVVSCPCAFVISIPLSFFGGIGAASKNGILIKGGNFIEALSKTETAVFDKTGTLTKGVFAVKDIHPLGTMRISAEQLLAIATHAELYSNHPISKSLKAAHHGDCCEQCTIDSTEEISGQGLKVQLNGQTILAGNLTLMKNQQVKGFAPCDKDDSGTVVHIAVDGNYIGHIIISDEIKPDSAQAVAELKKIGIRKTVLLTGDTAENADRVAEQTGVDVWYADLLPEDKLSEMETLLQEKDPNRTLLYAGDGINDAPVLARADVGIAMGGLGTDSAIEAADVIIMTDEPKKIADSIKISKRTMHIVRQNIILAFTVKSAVLVLSAFGLATMWAAVFADVGVTVIAVLNAMRQLAAATFYRSDDGI